MKKQSSSYGNNMYQYRNTHEKKREGRQPVIYGENEEENVCRQLVIVVLLLNGVVRNEESRNESNEIEINVIEMLAEMA